MEWSMVGEFVFASCKYGGEASDWESASLVPANLIDSIARYTSIPVKPAGEDADLGTEQIFNYPFVWMTGHLPVRFTDVERANLKKYVERGGFFVCDDHNHDQEGIFSKTARDEIERIFGKLVEVPKEHPIYHCFFEFSDGPPATSHELNGWGDQLVHKSLYGVFHNGRLSLLFSNKDYSSEWSFHPDTKREMQVDPTRFGVNLIIYALTR
jgi:hypothetical protein